MICHYWCFLNLYYTYELYISNEYHDISMMAYELENIAILNIKGVDYRCVIWHMARSDATDMLNSSKLDDKGLCVMNMNFGANKTPAEVIKEGAFGGNCFSDIYSGVKRKWYRKSWKEFEELDQNYYYLNYHDISINKYVVKCETSLRFWENKGWINSLNPYGWFQWYFRYWLSRKSLDDESQNARWKGIVSRFKRKLVKMIKGIFGDYSISPKIWQILLHWGYKLVENDLLWFIFLVNKKMS